MENIKFKDRDMLAEDLLKMLEQGSLHDVRIKLSDGEIVANKDILMARSEYFATMFSNNKFIEGETSTVDMRHCSKAVMEKIIKFLFSGVIKFSDLCLIQLLELSHMSDMMLLTKIKAEVDVYAVRVICRGSGINGENDKFLLELISGLKFAEQYNLSSLKPYIITELYCGLKGIPNDAECSDSFKTLSFNLIQDIFMIRRYRTIRSLYPPTTKERLKAFMVWLSENEVTVEQKNESMDSFYFEDFTVEELTTVRLYSASKIDERVLDLVKKKDALLKEKDLKIKEQDLKINELKDTLQDAKKVHSFLSFK
jgi:hypothetical protein